MAICLHGVDVIHRLSAGAVIGIVVGGVAALILLLFFIDLRRRRRAKQPTYKLINGFTSISGAEPLTPEAIHEARASTQHLIPSPHPSMGSLRQEYSPGMVGTQATYSMYASIEDPNQMVWLRMVLHFTNACSPYLSSIKTGASTHCSVYSRREIQARSCVCTASAASPYRCQESNTHGRRSACYFIVTVVPRRDAKHTSTSTN